MTTPSTLDRRAITLAVSSYFTWGLFPIYWKFLARLSAVEILAHRFIWSFVFYALVFWFSSSKNSGFKILLRQDRKGWIAAALSALLLGINWGFYIFAVNSGQVLQGSLAYFINPLMSVAVGVVLFNEAFPAVLKLAIALASVGVIYQAAFTTVFPWIALTLATSFCIYGVIKKNLKVPPELSSLMEGVTGLVPALVAAYWIRQNSDVSLTYQEWALLIGSGVVTGMPLFFFSSAAQKLPISLMGMLQYIGPTLQFFVGAFIFGEELKLSSLISFLFIWSGVGFYLAYQIGRMRMNKSNERRV
jgi:chloramphenicol-sensitive protein RarD